MVLHGETATQSYLRYNNPTVPASTDRNEGRMESVDTGGGEDGIVKRASSLFLVLEISALIIRFCKNQRLLLKQKGAARIRFVLRFFEC
jgi:hypothetical protein